MVLTRPELLRAKTPGAATPTEPPPGEPAPFEALADMFASIEWITGTRVGRAVALAQWPGSHLLNLSARVDELPFDQVDLTKPLPGLKFEHRAVEDALGVFAARIDQRGPAKLPDPSGLVDVAVQAEHRLVFQDGLPHSRAPDRDHIRLPDRVEDHAHVLCELRRSVNACVIRGHVDAEHRLVYALDAAGQGVDLGGQLLFGNVARAVPRGRIRVTQPQHLEAVQV